jgi:plasmid stabilization system protein ParE
MARVEITPRVLADLERLFEFKPERNPEKAREQLLSGRRALALLADHPLLGRDAEDGRRELVLLRGRDAYIAKCRWLPAEETPAPCSLEASHVTLGQNRLPTRQNSSLRLVIPTSAGRDPRLRSTPCSQPSSRAAFGMHAPPVTIDVHTGPGLPSMYVVGLVEGAVKEVKDSVRSAIQLAGFEWPPGRITVNLSPVDLPIEGGRLDLPIAPPTVSSFSMSSRSSSVRSSATPPRPGNLRSAPVRRGDAESLGARLRTDSAGRATIADLAGADALSVHHVSEALLFRQLDAEGFDTPLQAIACAPAREASPAPGVR